MLKVCIHLAVPQSASWWGTLDRWTNCWMANTPLCTSPPITTMSTASNCWWRMWVHHRIDYFLLLHRRRKHRKQTWLLAFKKTNQNTHEVKNERFLISTRQNNVRISVGIRIRCLITAYVDYHTRSLRGRELFNCDLQQWNSAKFVVSFWCFISVCRLSFCYLVFWLLACLLAWLAGWLIYSWLIIMSTDW